MRFSMIFGFVLAIVAASGAVWGARNWLNAERAAILQNQPSQAVDEKPKDTIVVAREAINLTQRLSKSNLMEIEWSGSVRPEGAFRTVDELVGDESAEVARYAVTAITIGEPILATKITNPGERAKLSTMLPDGMKAVSIRVNDVLGVAGFIQPGDRVDIMLARDNFVDLLLQGVRVLAIDQLADENRDKPSVVRTVTLAVNTTEAGKLVLASQKGVLSLALRHVASNEIAPPTRITVDDLSDFDVSNELSDSAGGVMLEEQKAIEIVENVDAPAQPDADDERFASLENMLREFNGNVNNRLSEMEEQLLRPDPEPGIDVSTQIAAPPPPIQTKVGVIRNGQRVEYKVGNNVDGTVVDAELQQVVTQ